MTTDHDTTPKRRPFLRPDDVRLPATVDEANAALAMIGEQVRSITDAIEHRVASGHPVEALGRVMRSWHRRENEVRYVRARLVAGSARDGMIEELVALRQRCEAAEHEAALRVASATERVERVERIAAQAQAEAVRLREERRGIGRGYEVTIGHKKEHIAAQDARIAMLTTAAVNARMHGLYAIRSMQAAGAPLTPVAAEVLRGVLRQLSPGEVTEWMRTCAGPLRDVAVRCADANDAGCAEPAAERVEVLLRDGAPGV